MSEPSLKYRILLRFFFSLMAAALSVLTSHQVFLSVPTGADENSYIFQAYIFSEGKIARPAPTLKEAFKQEMIILDDHAGWLSRYPPAHSLWLVPGIWMGNLYVMIGLAAALGMWFICLAASEVKIPEWLVGVPLLLSPFFGFMYGTLLSHTSGFMTVACMLWAYLRWRNTGHWLFAVIAGLAWSFFFLNRTYTALLVAIPFGVDAMLMGILDRNFKRWIGIACFAASSLTGVFLYLVYNELTTGSALNATYLYYEPSENLGFGPRRTQGMVIHHSLENGINNMRFDIQQLNRWLLGFSGSLIMWAMLILAGWRNKYSWLLAASTLSVWFGYIYFWFPGVKDAGGPVYFFETIPMILILGGFGLLRIWNGLAAWPRMRMIAFGTTLVALSIISAGFSMKEATSRIKKQRAKRNIVDVIRSAPPQSLIFIEDLKKPHIGEMVVNLQGLDSDPLLMKSMYEGNATAAKIYTNRTPFLLHGNKPGKLVPLDAKPRIKLGRNARNFHKTTGRDVAFDTEVKTTVVRQAAENIDPAGVLMYGKTIPLPRGNFDVVLNGTYKGIRDDQPTRIEIHSSASRNVAGSAMLTGSSETNIFKFRINITNEVTLAEPQVHFGGSGTVTVMRVSFEEIP